MSTDDSLGIGILRTLLAEWDANETPDSATDMGNTLVEVFEAVRLVIVAHDFTTPEHPLVTAYHTLFDYKDTLEPGSLKYGEVADVVRSINKGLALMGVDTVVRYDAPKSVIDSHSIHQGTQRPNPRKNADDAYDAFMSMGLDEWQACLFSVLKGGRFEVEEQKGFERALKDRKPVSS